MCGMSVTVTPTTPQLVVDATVRHSDSSKLSVDWTTAGRRPPDH